MLWNLGVQPRGENASCLGILQTVEQRAKNSKARGDDAARVAGVHSLLQDFDGQIADDRAAQRVGHPQLLVVSASAVETDDQARRADAIAELLDVGRKIRRTTLFIAFDDHHDARMRRFLFLHRAHRGHRGKHRVTVVGGAASVELSVAEDGRPGAEAGFPADHGRLFIEMAIHQYGGGAVTLDLDP